MNIIGSSVIAYGPTCVLIIAGGDKFINTSSIGAAFITHAAMQSFLYYTKTPTNEFSKDMLFAHAIAGGSVGMGVDGMSGLLHRFTINDTIRQAAIRAGVAAYAEILQGIISSFSKKYYSDPDDQELTQGKIVTAASVGAIFSITCSIVEKIANTIFGNVETFKRSILEEAVKKGLGAAIGTFIRNSYVEYGYNTISKTELLRAMFLGGVLGAAGATLQGAIPVEIQAKKEEIEKATKEYERLHEEYINSRYSYERWKVQDSQHDLVKKLEQQLITLLRPTRVCDALIAAIPSTCAATDSLKMRIKKAEAAISNASSEKMRARKTLEALRNKQRKLACV